MANNYEGMYRQIQAIHSLSLNVKVAAIKINEQLKGKRNMEAKRTLILKNLTQYAELNPSQHFSPRYDYHSHDERLRDWKIAKGDALASKCGYENDEHGRWNRGDYLSISIYDFKLYKDTMTSPFFNTAKDCEGMAVIEIERQRVYAKSSNWRNSTATTRFLIGQNEIGTYYSHPISKNCDTIEAALNWIWSNHENDIILRQGDVALVKGVGRKLPELPSSHYIQDGFVKHETHFQDLPLPQKGQRIIVGRRAAAIATEASRD